MSAKTFTAHICIERNGDEFEVEVSAEIVPREKGEPADMGEVTATTVEGDEVELDGEELKRAEDAIWDAATGYRDDGPDPDDERDYRMDR